MRACPQAFLFREAAGVPRACWFFELGRVGC